MMVDEFLLARIAEDEAVARAATAGPWHWDPPSGEDWPGSDESLMSSALDEDGHALPVLYSWGYDASGIDGEDGDRAHIVRWDPARVLAECKAKRRIVENHQRHTPGERGYGASREAVRALASVYADHPDFDPAWR